MALPRGAYYRIRTYQSGKRVRQTVLNGRVIETRAMPRIKQTKTRQALKRRKRRIGYR